MPKLSTKQKPNKYAVLLRNQLIKDLCKDELSLADILAVGKLWPKTRQGVAHILKSN